MYTKLITAVNVIFNRLFGTQYFLVLNNLVNVQCPFLIISNSTYSKTEGD